MAQPIDMKQLISVEKHKMEQKTVDTKQIARTDLFNLLQDLRHCVLIDLRKSADFEKKHIRGSLHYDPNDPATVTHLSDYIEKANTTFEKYESQSKSKRIRRFIIIDSKVTAFDKAIPAHAAIIGLLESMKDFDKVYYLKDGYESFEEKYAPLCIADDITWLDILESDMLAKMMMTGAAAIPALTEEEKSHHSKKSKVLYSFSKFPCEIRETELFVSNMYSAQSKPQLADLGIKSLLDFCPVAHPASYMTAGVTYKSLAFDPQVEVVIEFDEICEYIQKEMTESRKPVLMFCKDGRTMTPAFAIAWLMYSQKMDIQKASIIVFAKLSQVEVCKWVYKQLLLYEPGASKRVVKV